MPRTAAVLLAALLMQACAAAPAYRRGPDTYKSYSALRLFQAEGRDFSRETYARGAAVTVLAPHGGDIEPGTDRVARALAGKDLNLYIFSGWLGRASGRLHVTSTRFDDPEAVALSSAARLAVSVHGMAGRGEWACVGGRNAYAAGRAAYRLQAAGFEAETPCARLPGTSEKNLVNFASGGGVQLELTPRLLGRLARDPETMNRFAGALRLAVFESLEKMTQENPQ
jgi:phage replication-related protein YjqB (UPF0714/DUF867 family)